MKSTDNSQSVEPNGQCAQVKTGILGKLKNMMGLQSSLTGRPKEKDL